MTARELYDAILIELNKENAPNILLEQFNYLANKSINQYVNKRYNIYDISQQTTDDLRVLKATAILDVDKTNVYNDLSLASNATYETVLPSDYLHILNCICIYDVKKTYKCYNAGDTWRCAAIRLTSDAYSQVLDNFWSKPSYKKPYYYIHNVNKSEENPTNPYGAVGRKLTGTDIKALSEGWYKYSEDEIAYYYKDGKLYCFRGLNGSSQNVYLCFGVTGTGNKINSITLGPTSDIPGHSPKLQQVTVSTFTYSDNGGEQSVVIPVLNPNASALIPIVAGSDYIRDLYITGTDAFGNLIIDPEGLPHSIKINGFNTSNVERASQVRYGNASQVRLEIRYGTDDSIFELKKVYIDYIKAPQHIRLTQAQIDYTEDRSQVLEFPDYVCQEIINELVHIVMENISDQRLQTHPVVSQSIANPAQTQTPEAAG